jgi:hypothetical protein
MHARGAGIGLGFERREGLEATMKRIVTGFALFNKSMR